MIRPREALPIASAILLFAGCSYQCTFTLQGTVRDGATGEPIPNVKVEIQDADHYKLANAVFSNHRGEFQLAFQTSPRAAERTGWRVVLEANQFEATAIELGNVKEPASPKETTHIVLHVHLRRSP